MEIEEMRRRITVMQEEINAAAYVIKHIMEDINELKGELSKQEDDLR